MRPHLQKPPAELRKKARIRTIQSSLEIEGNTLTEEQITAILENKRVIAPQKDILEVKNAITVYDQLSEFNPYSLASFCKAHKGLMTGLVEFPGQLRTKGVGIVKGSEITHVAPPGGMVKALLNDLFAYLKKDKDLLLIKSCVFQYELEFIHPFMDGNGRMGRLWQTVLLISNYPVFEFLPIESIIKERQIRYYEAFPKAGKMGQSTVFVEFMLEVINDASVYGRLRTLSQSIALLIFKYLQPPVSQTAKPLFMLSCRSLSGCKGLLCRQVSSVTFAGSTEKTTSTHEIIYFFLIRGVFYPACYEPDRL